MALMGKGRILKILKYSDQTNYIHTGISREGQRTCNRNPKLHGSNGTYLEFGDYHGTRMDLYFSLYDSEKFTISYGGHTYQLPRKFKFEVYKEVKRIYNIKRMSKEVYSNFLKLSGSKITISFGIKEESVNKDEYGQVIANVDYTLGIHVDDKSICGSIQVDLKEVK